MDKSDYNLYINTLERKNKEMIDCLSFIYKISEKFDYSSQINHVSKKEIEKQTGKTIEEVL